MSDKARDEIADIVMEALFLGQRQGMEMALNSSISKGVTTDIGPYSDQIIALIRKEGYIHPDDLAEGMVHFVCDFPGDLPITKEHCPAEEYKATRQLSGKWRWDSCKNYPCQYLSTRPATVRECLAGLAVEG